MKNFVLGSVTVSGLLLFAGVAKAEIGVGDKMPALDAKKIEGGAVRILDELKGKVVLYEIFAFW